MLNALLNKTFPSFSFDSGLFNEYLLTTAMDGSSAGFYQLLENHLVGTGYKADEENMGTRHVLPEREEGLLS